MPLDLTGIITASIAGFFGLAGIILPLLINSRMKDTAAATTLDKAVTNALGKMEQASETAIVAARPKVDLPAIPGAPPALAVGVQYVLDHAGVEAERFGVTPASIADKIIARTGLASIAAKAASTIDVEPPPRPPATT